MWPRGQPCGTVPAWSRDFSPATPAFSHHMAPYSYLLSPSATSLVGKNDIEDGVSSWSGRSAAGEPSPWGPPRDRHGGHGCIREPPFPSWGPRRASYPRAQVSPGEAGPALGGWGTRKASGRRVVTQGVRSSGSLGGAAPRPVAVHPPAFPLRVGEQSGRVVRLPRTFFFFFLRRISFSVVVDDFVSSLMLNVSPSQASRLFRLTEKVCPPPTADAPLIGGTARSPHVGPCRLCSVLECWSLDFFVAHGTRAP